MNSRYQIVPTIRYESTGSTYYVNNIYPEIPVTEEDDYVITVLGDRLDLLAFDFYGDSSFWWIIASANSLSGDSIYLEPGLQIRIPSNLPAVVNQYRSTNDLR
jgi:hypothetical protein